MSKRAGSMTHNFDLIYGRRQPQFIAFRPVTAETRFRNYRGRENHDLGDEDSVRPEVNVNGYGHVR